ncbi:hypothetical protein MMC20_001183 [Loxospora ochrophaea]|nr:hypothetical protein [Loxospora ochrophaea]
MAHNIKPSPTLGPIQTKLPPSPFPFPFREPNAPRNQPKPRKLKPKTDLSMRIPRRVLRTKRLLSPPPPPPVNRVFPKDAESVKVSQEDGENGVLDGLTGLAEILRTGVACHGAEKRKEIEAWLAEAQKERDKYGRWIDWEEQGGIAQDPPIWEKLRRDREIYLERERHESEIKRQRNMGMGLWCGSGLDDEKLEEREVRMKKLIEGKEHKDREVSREEMQGMRRGFGNPSIGGQRPPGKGSVPHHIPGTYPNPGQYLGPAVRPEPVARRHCLLDGHHFSLYQPPKGEGETKNRKTPISEGKLCNCQQCWSKTRQEETWICETKVCGTMLCQKCAQYQNGRGVEGRGMIG